MEVAKASETRWVHGESLDPIDGVSTTIIDTMLCKGWPTMKVSKISHPNAQNNIDFPSVARLP